MPSARQAQSQPSRCMRVPAGSGHLRSSSAGALPQPDLNHLLRQALQPRVVECPLCRGAGGEWEHGGQQHMQAGAANDRQPLSAPHLRARAGAPAAPPAAPAAGAPPPAPSQTAGQGGGRGGGRHTVCRARQLACSADNKQALQRRSPAPGSAPAPASRGCPWPACRAGQCPAAPPPCSLVGWHRREQAAWSAGRGAAQGRRHAPHTAGAAGSSATPAPAPEPALQQQLPSCSGQGRGGLAPTAQRCSRWAHPPR